MCETSEVIRQRVQAARERQRTRFSHNGSSDMICNADMRIGEIRQFCRLQDEGCALPSRTGVPPLIAARTVSVSKCQSLMRAAMSQLQLSARVYYRILKLSCTISDLAGSEDIQSARLAEALQYRPKIMMG